MTYGGTGGGRLHRQLEHDRLYQNIDVVTPRKALLSVEVHQDCHEVEIHV